MTTKQASALAALLSARRRELSLSARKLGVISGVDNATIVRLEQGAILTPQPETLKALARALDLSLSDVFATADWVESAELPTFTPYLRAKYSNLPEAAVDELAKDFGRLAKKYGVDSNGPVNGEDEH